MLQDAVWTAKIMLGVVLFSELVGDVHLQYKDCKF